jgi:hypothetical protein
MARMRESAANLRRWAILAGCALLCGGLSAMAAQLGHAWSLPPSDGAYGSALRVLFDPFSLAVAAVIAVPASALGLLAARIFLWNTRLARTVPVVMGVSVLVSFLGGRLGLFAAPLALFVAFLAMVWCEEHFPLARERRLPSVRGRAI